MKKIIKTVVNKKTNRYGEIFAVGNGSFYFEVYTLKEFFLFKSGIIGTQKQAFCGLYFYLDAEWLPLYDY